MIGIFYPVDGFNQIPDCLHIGCEALKEDIIVIRMGNHQQTFIG
jgi:hypothetical protein